MESISPATISYSTKRLQYVDIAKFIGLTLVILSHTTFPRFFWCKYYNLVFIPIFFVCSGYTTNPDKPINLKNKAKKLLLPYLAFNLIFIIIWLVTGRHIDFFTLTGAIYSRFCLYPLSDPDNIYFFNMNGPTWFFTALFTSFVLFKLIMLIPKASLRVALVFVYLLIAAALSLLPILLPWSIDTAFFFASLMYAGQVMRSRDIINPPFSFYIIPLLITSIVCFSMVRGINLSVREYGIFCDIADASNAPARFLPQLTDIVFNFVGAVAGCILLIKFSNIIERFRISQLFVKINSQALTIFALQMLFIAPIGEIWNMIQRAYIHTSGLINALSACVILIQLAAALICGYFAGRFLSAKIPCVFK